MGLDYNYINLLRELIHDRLGIYISQEKDYLIESKLARLLQKTGRSSIAEFYNSLKNNDSEAFESLVRYITTTHTFFFRESKHLTILKNDILIKKNEKPLIWVAASSTGEEVYSIIIELLESGIADFFIVATDINREVLAHMKGGVYSEDRMREMSDEIKGKYFTRVAGKGNYYKIKDHLKKFLIVKKINLIHRMRFERKFDYIFCRNVLIYFNNETQKVVIDNLLDNLNDLGYLFVGHSESLFHITGKVESVFSSVYNKKL